MFLAPVDSVDFSSAHAKINKYFKKPYTFDVDPKKTVDGNKNRTFLSQSQISQSQISHAINSGLKPVRHKNGLQKKIQYKLMLSYNDDMASEEP